MTYGEGWASVKVGARVVALETHDGCYDIEYESDDEYDSDDSYEYDSS